MPEDQTKQASLAIPDDVQKVAAKTGLSAAAVLWGRLILNGEAPHVGGQADRLQALESWRQKLVEKPARRKRANGR